MKPQTSGPDQGLHLKQISKSNQTNRYGLNTDKFHDDDWRNLDYKEVLFMNKNVYQSNNKQTKTREPLFLLQKCIDRANEYSLVVFHSKP